ncbi:MAG: DoxX family protein [Fimbriiglobus sp.]
MNLPLPIQLIYAGLAGSLLALIIATAQQKWKPRVFFLLALRLAIGWHFLFEGMNKIQSHMVGTTGDSKPFSSAPYFQEAEGPLGDMMRQKYLPDPEQKLNDLVRPVGAPKTVGELLGDDGRAWIGAEMGKTGPIATYTRIYTSDNDPKSILNLPLNGPGGAFLAGFPKTNGELPAQIEKPLLAAIPTGAAAKFNAIEAAIISSTDDKKKEAATTALKASRIAYARWAVGVDSKDMKKKFVSGDIAQNVPARLTDYANRIKDLESLKANRDVDLGRSTLFAKLTAAKADVAAVRNDLTKDADTMLTDAGTAITKAAGVELPKEPEASPSAIADMDKLTMWTLAIAGACLIVGLGTRIAAVVCVVFLTMTYLTHPPFPWLAHPPGTEGNPVFVNKNVIEAIALCVIAATPTGAWLGIDGLFSRYVLGKKTIAE